MRDPLRDVMAERARQDAKWGEQNHPDEWWLAILIEEVGEAARALVKSVLDNKPTGPMRKEVVELTAVGLAWLECIERRATIARAGG